MAGSQGRHGYRVMRGRPDLYSNPSNDDSAVRRAHTAELDRAYEASERARIMRSARPNLRALLAMGDRAAAAAGRRRLSNS